jgi:hypothetical protein
MGDTYATLPELKKYLQSSNASDSMLEDALATATADIDEFCNRHFNRDDAASARVYCPKAFYELEVDDFHTTAGLIIKTDFNGDGTFETTWSATDYELKPFNGVVNGKPGWPYNKINAVGSHWFPVYDHVGLRYGHHQATVEVTAQWGWAAVPAPVKQACLILAAEAYELKGAPLGVAGMSEFGIVRVRRNPIVATKLLPYVKNRLQVG